MSTVGHYPEIRSLDPDECREVLARQHLGRLAFSFHDRVDIQPVHYSLDGSWLYVRTSEGQKVITIAHHPWVAFEVDEVNGLLDWVSVVVHGTVYRIDAQGPTWDPEAEGRAIELLRQIMPGAFTGDDPVPHREVLLRIAIRELTGRRASSSWTRAEGRDTASY